MPCDFVRERRSLLARCVDLCGPRAPSHFSSDIVRRHTTRSRVRVEWFDPAISKRLLGFQPDDVQWVISFAYAIRRANSIEAAIEILLNAEPKFPKQAVIKYNLACYFCQLGDLESVKKYLKRAFEIDPNWRLQALEDEDLEALWESL